MDVKKKRIEGMLELTPKVFEDDRGFLARIYEERAFEELGFSGKWTEISHHHTSRKNILRGLYVQRSPFSEGKLLRVIKGKMLWVSVDVRQGSPTFGQWDSVVLSEQDKNILLTARGLMHGCISLEDKTDLLIQSDNYFSAEHGVGVIWNDPDLKIDWQLGGETPFVSERDKSYSSFQAFKEKYPEGL